MSANGFRGQVLRVNLTTGQLRTERLDPLINRTYMGGPALGAYFLLKEQAPGADPLGPDNMLVFSCGLLTGTPAPSTPRYTVTTRSPLTGAISKAEAGGWWGPALRRAGFDALIVEGRAAQPVYLWIKDGAAQIRDAAHLWGKVTGEAAALIRQELGEKRARILQIGPGGENLVRFANISNELVHFNGRNGVGAVMGSKNLKAIAVLGSDPVPVSDEQSIKEIARWMAKAYKDYPLSFGLHNLGTVTGMANNNAAGALPTRNWTAGVFERTEAIDADRYHAEILVNRGGCFACPINCKRVVEVNDGQLHVDPLYGGPEYETMAALGSNCGIGNLQLVAKAGELCNRYTIDTITTGMVISFAMHCFEEGIITRADTGGLELRFGNEEVLLPLIEAIAYRRGFGALLAEGSARAAAQIGGRASELLLQVKGQEVPMHDPRVKTGLGLQYSLGPYGADHWFAQHDPLFAQAGSPSLASVEPLGILAPVAPMDTGPAKVRLFYYTSTMVAMLDLLGLCIFGAVSRSIIPLPKVLQLVAASTGWQTSLWELMKAGERSICMARVFNAREGFTTAQDVLPERFFEAIGGGPAAGNLVDRREFAGAVQLYYQMAGLDPASGAPTAARLWELDLGWLAAPQA